MSRRLLLLAGLVWSAPGTLPGQAQPIRVGFIELAPYAFERPDGPSGFYVDVFREAAERLGTGIEPVFTRRGITGALEGGEVDLWAGGAPSAERRRIHYFTEPWWIDDQYLLVVSSSPIWSARELRGKRLVYEETPPQPQPLEQVFPGTNLRKAGNWRGQVAALCSGAADVALISRASLNRFMLGAFNPCASAALRLIPEPIPSLEIATVALYRNRDLADRFRSAIQDMLHDGSLTRLALRYPLLGAHSARMIQEEQQRVEWSRDILRMLLVGAVALLLAGSIALNGLRRANRRTGRALEQARDLTAQLLAAQDQERRRIARELHDSTAQQLAALSMNLHTLKGRMAAAGIPAGALIEDSLQAAGDCIRELRSLSYLMHPPLLDEFGLPVALRSLVDGYCERTGMVVKVDVAPDFPRLESRCELALMRVAQESLANVHRHAGCRQAAVRLRRTDGAVCLEIEDEGLGRSGMPPGVGIRGMRERMQSLGGGLEILSGGSGTLVRAMLPAEV